MVNPACFVFALQAVYFFGIQQQLAAARRVGFCVGGSCCQWRKVAAEQEYFGAGYDDIRLVDLRPAGAGAFDFPSAVIPFPPSRFPI